MKQVEVTILGQGYILGCPEGGESLLANAVADVDREMTAIRDGGKVKARERIAVLAALNIAYQLAERRHAVSTPIAPVAEPAVARLSAQGVPFLEPEPQALAALVARIDAALDSDGHLL
jgi:cell division protein ZapA